MRNEEIHKGLNNQDIRDFLAKTYSECCHKGAFGAPELIEKKIRELQDHLELLKIKKATEKLIEINGWETYDLDEEKVPYNSETYFCFVGTKKEYENIFGKEEE